MKNQGISLISLIITIIVIIILAAIVIFSGMDTPERAQLSNFAQQVSNVHSAVIDQLTGVSTEFATSGRTRNAEQIYYKLATGWDCGQFGAMVVDDTTDTKLQNGSGDNYKTDEDKNCQRIIPANAAKKSTEGGLGLTLPDVRESKDAWYVTEDGKIFNATGFVSGGKTYFTADLYTEEELTMAAGDRTNHYPNRAAKIAEYLISGDTNVIAKSTLPNN